MPQSQASATPFNQELKHFYPSQETPNILLLLLWQCFTKICFGVCLRFTLLSVGPSQTASRSIIRSKYFHLQPVRDVNTPEERREVAIKAISTVPCCCCVLSALVTTIVTNAGTLSQDCTWMDIMEMSAHLAFAPSSVN